VDFYARKIKQEGLVGMKTPKEGVRLTFERGTSRYFDPRLGISPLDVLARQRYAQTRTNEVPTATQGTMPLRASTPNEFADNWHPNGTPITRSNLSA
jgi:hypothetical protein